MVYTIANLNCPKAQLTVLKVRQTEGSMAVGGCEVLGTHKAERQQLRLQKEIV